ncbi:MAG: T9SS type A sorting domain-containing protein [Prevotellaceae bacterium]|jgi:1,4-alpha-glucan branching enzyme|nr:T9SS type A sorting domain-containing protein [Prevotellaceae bacterium]
MKNLIPLLFIFFASALACRAQTCSDYTWTTEPGIFSENSPVTFTVKFGCSYDWTNSEDVYIWLWGDPGGSHNEQQGEWSNTNSSHKMTKVGERTYRFVVSQPIGQFLRAEPSALETVGVLAKTQSGAASGGSECKTTDKKIPLAQGFMVRITAPEANLLYAAGDTVYVAASATESVRMSLSFDGELRKSVDNVTTLLDTIYGLAAGDHRLVVRAQNASDAIAADSLTLTVPADPEISPAPVGLKEGVTYHDNAKATLALFAPGKTSVFVIGDFNGWQMSNEYQMKRDGDMFWITLDNLVPGQEYAYQYLIDQSLRVADPYAEKILDPWNDSYIDRQVYPNLKPYPQGKTTGIVSTLQTAQTPYAWATDSYARPAQEKLNIYELLVRDFTAAHAYSAVIDSLKYLKRLGINAVELLPVNEFEGNESWGYNPSFYFAPDKYYGTKNELKRLVDSCHANGIAVIVDLVLNHSFGLSPMVQMYWDANNNRPSAESPWFNPTSPNPDYYWGSDFNHQSPHTQRFVDRVNRFWLQEYRMDGIRFDFTKGFTNTRGNGWAYDAQRIGLLKRMADSIRTHTPDAFLILEHLTDNREEQELASYGFMLWGNVNNNACEAIMGYTESKKSDLSAASYKSKGWSVPHLVAYMESHDEERMMYKAKSWGKKTGSYDVKQEAIGLQRAALCATVFFSVPGPKMIWQFGELGYDYSINACPDGTENEGCRTANKPIRWDYLQNDYRRNLYLHYAEILQLRNAHEIFHTADFSTSLEGEVKTVTLRSDNMSAVVVGNFASESRTATLTLPTQGTWYEYFSQTSGAAADMQELSLAPGSYRLLTSAKIDRLNLPFVDLPDSVATAAPALRDDGGAAVQIRAYPNPAQDVLHVELSADPHHGDLTFYLYNMLGQAVCSRPLAATDGTRYAATIDCSDIPQGAYILSVQNGKGKQLAGRVIAVKR